jgi:RNase H-fold protein (predicted Holliday junction resolvase)
LAVWESSLTFPLPRTPLRVRNDDEAVARLAALLKEEPVDRLLVGLPQERDVGRSWIVRKARAFGRRLEEATGVPVEFVPEAFTTREAAALSPRPEGDDTVDSLASAKILEAWLASCPRA